MNKFILSFNKFLFIVSSTIAASALTCSCSNIFDENNPFVENSIFKEKKEHKKFYGKLHLNNFNAKSKFNQTHEKDTVFNSHAKTCVTGEPSSAIKLAELYKSSLDSSSADYLYYQQPSFNKEFKLCHTFIKDSLSYFNKAKDRKTRHIFNIENKINEYQQAFNIIDAAVINDKKTIKHIVRTFLEKKDFENVYYWLRYATMNIYYTPQKTNLFVGKYLFKIDEHKDFGYSLVETSARNGFQAAIDTLKTTDFAKYRNDNIHSDTHNKIYKEIIEKH